MALRTGRSIVSLAEAQKILAALGAPIDRTERLPLARLSGRVLAEGLAATIDVPPYDRALMDGYAVRAADLAACSPDRPVSLELLETIYTGSLPARSVTAGSCAAVATGAPLPDGADAVIMIEGTSKAGQSVTFDAPARSGQNIGRRGGDLASGTLMLPAGTWLTPARVGCIAAVGMTSALVYERPRVALLSTGDEVVPPGQPLGPGQLYDVNTVTLSAVVEAHGGEAVRHAIAPDVEERLREAFERTLDADLVLFTGGSSVGDRDFVLGILESAGDVHVQGIALKPGKPTIVATVGGRPVFGMPGNPTSCLTIGYLLVAPMLRRLARVPPAVPVRVRARLSARVTSPQGRHQFFPVRVEDGTAVPAFKGSGEITSLARADGYFEIPVDQDAVEAGALVDVTLF